MHREYGDSPEQSANMSFGETWIAVKCHLDWKPNYQANIQTTVFARKSVPWDTKAFIINNLSAYIGPGHCYL